MTGGPDIRRAGAALVLLLLAARLIAADTAANFPLVRLSTDAGESVAALAETPGQRSIGYRHIERDDAPNAIYFRYPEPDMVSFHMRDVAFPVRAYWIGADECISGFTEMVPGESGYSPPGPVVAVLEVPDWNKALTGLEPGDCVHRTGK